MAKDRRGDSTIQQRAERVIRRLLRRKFGKLQEKKVCLGNGIQLEVDAVSADERILIEIFARQGPLKDGQKKKIAKDLFKLAFIGRSLDNRPLNSSSQNSSSQNRRLVFAHANSSISKHLKDGSWLSRAAATFNIEVVSLEKCLPERLKNRIKDAQGVQAERFVQTSK